jgi:hypothetical protein
MPPLALGQHTEDVRFELRATGTTQAPTIEGARASILNAFHASVPLPPCACAR